MDLPKILLLGRPNVGKSTLLNKLLRRRAAITFDTPGVTRDLNEFVIEHAEKQCLLVDSGGVFVDDSADFEFQEDVERLVQSVLPDVSVVFFVVDAVDGVLPSDMKIAKLLRRHAPERVMVLVNKVDNDGLADQVSDFYKLGLGDPFAVSGIHGRGLNAVLDKAMRSFQRSDKQAGRLEKRVKVGIIGRPNVGKSSLVNALIDSDQIIVSDKSGTTRDSIHYFFQHADTTFEFVDTAGIRRSGKIKGNIEFYSVVRTKETIKEADIVICILDAERGFSSQDKKIISLIIEYGKSLILFVNKWDALKEEGEVKKDFTRLMIGQVPALINYPILFGSALEKEGLSGLLNKIPDIMATVGARIQTRLLNDFNRDVIKRFPPPVKYGKRVKIYYLTQVEKIPPTFVCFVNHKKYINQDYHRFLEKRMRTYLGGFEGHTIRLIFKNHRGESEAETS